MLLFLFTQFNAIKSQAMFPISETTRLPTSLSLDIVLIFENIGTQKLFVTMLYIFCTAHLDFLWWPIQQSIFVLTCLQAGFHVFIWTVWKFQILYSFNTGCKVHIIIDGLRHLFYSLSKTLSEAFQSYLEQFPSDGVSCDWISSISELETSRPCHNSTILEI